uniref:Cryptide TyPep-2 n=1 Tax=Tityus serrulatus TaxID=6887 RepID=CRY2_TITSE
GCDALLSGDHGGLISANGC